MTRAKQVFVAFLRGINVGGRNRLPMSRLVEIFEAAGGTEVQTYIQSGNVLFRASAARARRVPSQVTSAIRSEFGFECPVLLRSESELKALLSDLPFDVNRDRESTLHIVFLEEEPSPERVRNLDADRSPPESFVVHGREIFISSPNGVARSKLTNAYFERVLGTPTTARNLKTTRTMLELASGR